MLALTFKAKLKRLNKDLYVVDDKATNAGGTFARSGLFLRRKKKTQALSWSDKLALDSATRAFIEQSDGGFLDEHICAVPVSEIAEHEQFNAEGKLMARGWRSVVLLLVAKGICSIDKARSVFSSSLGEQEYDKLPLHLKLKWAKGYRFKDEPLTDLQKLKAGNYVI